MLLILSHVFGTPNAVIDWIDSRGIPFHRINPYSDDIVLHEIQLTNDKIDIELELKNYGIRTKLSDYSGVWIWHGHLKFANCDSKRLNDQEDPLLDMIEQSMLRHHETLIDYVAEFPFALNLNIIGNYKQQNVNKLIVLLKARNLGIAIPGTYILADKTRIGDLLLKEELITKPYHEINSIEYNKTRYTNYTSTVTAETLSVADHEIFPTLVQKKIQKLFEVRSFFLNGKFYSMAIFSQASDKTLSDFRNYDQESPNRTIPFQLPSELEEKLKQLFKELGLNSGSLDLIYTVDDEYVFLEINPVGQFSMVSYPCNYYLEKLIMETLTNGRCK
ncbi:MAG: hypothetical protein JWO44_1787 [Bacteroidetes bacterium]|nr:hypothetical protein [Bacteroidota bacterium]